MPHRYVSSVVEHPWIVRHRSINSGFIYCCLEADTTTIKLTFFYQIRSQPSPFFCLPHAFRPHFVKMMNKVFFYCKLIRVALSLGLERVGYLISARIHRLTYKAVPNPKNVVVVGGSFAGFFLAKQLADSLPTGYRVIVIEKHSHYYFTWNFPRVTVVEGHTQNAFIPYPEETSVQPAGVYSLRQGEVVEIGDSEVILSDGTSIPFEYLAIATGSNARYPAEMDADNKSDCVTFLEKQQQRIKVADHIVIVGAGAAGVEVAGDIMTTYTNKKVTLVHSRQQLLNKFGPELHNVAKKGLEDLGVELVLGDRVIAGLDSDGPVEIKLQSGKVLKADMLVGACTVSSWMPTYKRHRSEVQDNIHSPVLSKKPFHPQSRLLRTSLWRRPCRSRAALLTFSPVVM